MFTIKICGITGPDDARLVAQAGADAIGLNFYAKSPRFITAEQARAIIEALPAGIVKVGLFVNAATAAVCQTFDDLGLDLIQLHGDEPPGYLAELGGRPVMKVFRLSSDGLPQVRTYLNQCRRLASLPRLVLFDALVANVYGGSGQTADWPAAREYLGLPRLAPRSPDAAWPSVRVVRTMGRNPPMAIAGGLTPHNVAAAIRASGATAVDTASGVESSPGRKNAALVAAFVQAARVAWKGEWD